MLLRGPDAFDAGCKPAVSCYMCLSFARYASLVRVFLQDEEEWIEVEEEEGVQAK